jgi:1-deoxy-D-xylulose-5-phosphate synthase
LLDTYPGKLRTLYLPDSFIEQGNPQKMYEAAGLNASGIVESVLNMLETQTAKARSGR